MSNKPELEVENNSRIKIVYGISAAAFIIAAIVFGTIMYINSGYRNGVGTFDYKITYNTRKYEFVTSKQSIDIFQIKDLSKADCDCYVYVGTYDPTQDLQETLDIVNQTDGTNLQFMNTTVGSKDYPAIFIDYINDKGGYVYMYYIDYNGHNYVISTESDKAHQKEIDAMVDSFTIIE